MKRYETPVLTEILVEDDCIRTSVNQTDTIFNAKDFLD